MHGEPRVSAERRKSSVVVRMKIVVCTTALPSRVDADAWVGDKSAARVRARSSCRHRRAVGVAPESTRGRERERGKKRKGIIKSRRWPRRVE